MAASEAELRELMLAGLNGGSAAHRIFLEQVSRLLRGYYKRRLSSNGKGASEAEDLVQEALMAIHTRRHTYDRDQPLMPWLYAIARYKLVDYLRKAAPSFANVPLEDAAAVLAPDDQSSVESAYDLRRLLAQLPEKMRRAIECVKLDGLSVAEAAKRCGMSEAAVKVNVHRGLRALASSMQRRGEHEDG